MNIYQKLIEVRKSVPYLKKGNEGYQFSYVSSSQTLGHLKAKMDELGLLLVPNVTGKEISTRQTKKGDNEYFTELNINFTWINSDKPDEKIECPWYGQGLDAGEKGVGKALTYAEKYFMLKFFNIPTDKDDPDTFQGKINGDNGKDNKLPELTPEKTTAWKNAINAYKRDKNFVEIDKRFTVSEKHRSLIVDQSIEAK